MMALDCRNPCLSGGKTSFRHGIQPIVFQVWLWTRWPITGGSFRGHVHIFSRATVESRLRRQSARSRPPRSTPESAQARHPASRSRPRVPARVRLHPNAHTSAGTHPCKRPRPRAAEHCKQHAYLVLLWCTRKGVFVLLWSTRACPRALLASRTPARLRKIHTTRISVDNLAQCASAPHHIWRCVPLARHVPLAPRAQAHSAPYSAPSRTCAHRASLHSCRPRFPSTCARHPL